MTDLQIAIDKLTIVSSILEYKDSEVARRLTAQVLEYLQSIK